MLLTFFPFLSSLSLCFPFPSPLSFLPLPHTNNAYSLPSFPSLSLFLFPSPLFPLTHANIAYSLTFIPLSSPPSLFPSLSHSLLPHTKIGQLPFRSPLSRSLFPSLIPILPSPSILLLLLLYPSPPFPPLSTFIFLPPSLLPLPLDPLPFKGPSVPSLLGYHGIV